jgi:phenylacetate-coenzyme A ligase PaaK-like adenylate-forming protein
MAHRAIDAMFPPLVRRLAIDYFRRPDGRALFREALEVDRRNLQDEAQSQSLERLLRHCQQHVRYYRERMREAPPIRATSPAACLQRLPILTKDIIRQRFNELRSDDLRHRKWIYNTSGGSTGEPVRLIQDDSYLRHSDAITDLQYLWLKHRPGDRTLLLWGSERDILGGKASWRERLGTFLYNRVVLNAFLMTPQKMREYVGVINSFRPTLLLAYAQAAYELAGFIEEEKLDVNPPGAIMTSAGTLYDFMRERIQRVFRCPVVNRYGSREVGAVACECPQNGHLHVPPTGCYVEVVNEAGLPAPPETEGNILVTALGNYAMPLVRYFIGDRGVLSSETQCVCGRRGQMLRRVLGRTVDAFRLSDGTLIDGEYFTHLLYFRSWVRKFQVTQKAYDHIDYSIVGTRPDETELESIISKTRATMGADCRVTFQFVPEIREGGSGKYRYTISEVPRPHGVHTV